MSVTELLPEDRFLILACDGVWDCMSCQQAVRTRTSRHTHTVFIDRSHLMLCASLQCDFVSERLDLGVSVKDIVEQALRHCIAEDPRKSGGIGGDNMTFMVVLLHQSTEPQLSSTSLSARADGEKS